MLSQKNPIVAPIDSKTYPLGERSERVSGSHALARVALSHTPMEHCLYTTLLTFGDQNGSMNPTARALMTLTGIGSLSTIRRAIEGLLAKLSIERDEKPNGARGREPGASYRALVPEEIIARRNESGLETYDKTILFRSGNAAFEKAVARVVENKQLSRREGQVALCCVEGLTNAEIGARLRVSDQTVKFHLRHVFVKFGVRRRAELISRLLM